MEKYILASRPWSLSASLIPALLGNILAYKEVSKDFHIWVAILTTLCIICVHIAGNFINTYYDFINGVDGPKSADLTLVTNILLPSVVWNLSISCYLLSLLFFFVLLCICNVTFDIVLLFTFGVGLSFLYTGGLQLKYAAMGDLVIILTFGPIAVLFAFVSQTYIFSLQPLVLSLPIICLTEAILHANNYRDYDEDQQKQIKTLAMILGKPFSTIFYLALTTMSFVWTFRMGCFVNKAFFLPLVLIPNMLSLQRKCMNGDLEMLDQLTAQMHLLYGALYLYAVIYSF
eukprot:TCONS_00014703-protein